VRFVRAVIRRFRATEGLEVEFGPGLVVVEGPNEAGKSTLLAFLQTLLFPLGLQATTRVEGSLDLTTADGRSYRLERSGARASQRVIDLASGEQLDGSRLAALTGPLDANLYRDVFAFGLTELQGLDVLTGSAVKERLFSAAVAGAGENAARASRELDARLAELLKPRASGTVLAGRAAELRGHLAAAASARSEAGGYEALARQRDATTARAEAAGAELRLAATARDHTAAVLAAWEPWRAGQEAREALTRLAEEEAAFAAGRGEAPPARWLARAEAIDALGNGLAAHERTVADLDVRVAELGEHVATLRASLAELGPAWTAKRVAEFSQAAAWREQAGAAGARRVGLGEGRARLEGELKAAEAHLRDAEAAEEAARAEHERLGAGARSARTAEASGAPPGPDELVRLAARRRAALEGLEDLVAALNKVAADRAAVLERLSSPRDEGGRPGRWLGWAALLALVGAAAWLAAERALVYAALVLGLGGAAAVLLLPRGGRSGPGGATQAAGAARAALAERAEALRAEVATLREAVATRARALGFPDPATLAADLRGAQRGAAQELASLEAAERAARQHAAAEQAVLAARMSVRTAREGLAALAAEAAAADRAWTDWCVAAGLAPDTQADGVAAALKAIDRAQAAQRGYREAQAWVGPAGESVTAYRADVEGVARDMGQPAPTGAVRGAVEAWAAALAEARSRADELHGRRAALEAIVRDADRDLSTRFGARADEAAAQLGAADPQAWRSRLSGEEDTVVRLARSARDLDEEVGRLKQRLEDLARSTDLATHLQAADRVATEARGDARRWLVTSLAKALVDGTLEEYERTKVPAVLLRAGDHLSAMTRGRFVRVGQHEGRALRVFTARDEAFEPEELSRGTLEQLYLAVRLGLIASFSESNVALPLIFDDVLVNADPARAERLAAVLAGVAREQQLLFLTCHPHVARLLLDADPGATHVLLAGPPAA